MPESVEDPVFGRLDWDDGLEWWTGTIEFAGHPVEVFVGHDPDVGTPEDEIAAARGNLARVREREAEYRRWSAEQLYPKRWNADDGMTLAELVALLRVASLEFKPDGTTDIYWDDDEVLYCGHNVITEVASDGTCVSAGMQ
jgi:hypothetical protein